MEQMTRRSVSPFMESILFEPHKLLDHGSLTVVSYDGIESDIAQAARTSYQGGTKTVSEDAALLRRLIRERHSSPLEQATIRAHIKMPIFVARQWIRHRMASINEVSGRYSVLDNEFYIPDAEQLAAQSNNNKQGRDKLLTAEEAETVQCVLRHDAMKAYAHYETLLGSGESESGFTGIARELARMNLSLNFYTTWVWRTDLHNLLRFLSLRMDPHAQYEIRVYANRLGEIVEGWMPNVYQAFKDFQLDGYAVSGPMLHILKMLLRNTIKNRGTVLMASMQETAERLYPQCSKREMTEFLHAIGVNSEE